MHRLLIALALTLWAAAWFLTGIDWGLPTRDSDPFLFNGRAPWTGAEIMALAGPWGSDGDLGSDRAQHPVRRDRLVDLNATDSDRAQIVRRYRLYSRQPDEMNTFRALSRMNPSHLDLDPRMYQYGGLWIYPVGGLIKLGSLVGLVAVRSDVAYYLDHPEAFARFYVVARLYSASWGLVGVWVVAGLTRRMTGHGASGIAAGALFAVLPVVVNGAHEAKPHLAGTVLILATIWSGMDAVETGRRPWLPGLLAGAATGMVLTGVYAFGVPLVALYRRPRHLLAAVAVGVAVFAITNPFLLVDAAFHRARLTSNVGNYGNFYHPSVSFRSIGHALALGAEATTIPLLVAGFLRALLVAPARLAAARRAGRNRTSGRSPRPSGPPLNEEVPSDPIAKNRSTFTATATLGLVGLQFFALAADKPAEYARFAMPLAAYIAVMVVAGVFQLRCSPRERVMTAALLIAVVAYFSLRYEVNYLADGRPDSTRGSATVRLQHTDQPIVVRAEPAPYDLPPVDLWHRTIRLAPVDDPTPPPDALIVLPADDPTPGLRWPTSPISWANKPIRIGP